MYNSLKKMLLFYLKIIGHIYSEFFFEFFFKVFLYVAIQNTCNYKYTGNFEKFLLKANAKLSL